MNKECPALSYLENLGSQLTKELAQKHEDGEFLPEITNRSPHLHKRKKELLISYVDLLLDVGKAIREYKSKRETKEKIKILAKNLKKSKSLEHKLVFDSFLIELGENH